MKVKVIASGEIIEVMPSYLNDEVVCYKHEQESGVPRIYRPEEVEIIESVEHQYRSANSEYDWELARIKSAMIALQGCIISGKPNPVQSAMRYSKELVDALRTEYEGC